ncbi:MAG: hypothetical protein CVU18_16730 [Betaproteobacteria bacterium HGW-Betaproteobacteria-12]|nr:MAG: hypothetical protein CVU18_16730 [Betaproteobacteria bacterium HGW-Betaproteobacteria-12]
MHWASILTALALASISAFLVAFQGWDVQPALLVSGGIAVLLILVLTGILLMLSKPEHRQGLTREILAAMHAEFKEMLRWMLIKR